MQISELARRAGVSVHALRHYERLGLLVPLRQANGYRDYPETARREAVFIAMSRQLGFALREIAPRLARFRAGSLRVQDMAEALQQRATALQSQMDALEAQKQRVLDHRAWLLERSQKPTRTGREAAGTPSARNAAAWPRPRPSGAEQQADRIQPRKPR